MTQFLVPASINPPIRGSIGACKRRFQTCRVCLNPPIRGSIALSRSRIFSTQTSQSPYKGFNRHEPYLRIAYSSIISINPPIRGSIEIGSFQGYGYLLTSINPPIRGSIVKNITLKEYAKLYQSPYKGFNR